MNAWLQRLAAWDARLSARLRVDGRPFWRRLATVAAHFGDGPLWFLLWAIGILWLPEPTRRAIVLWVGASLIAAVVTYTIKFTLKRPRPAEVKGFYSRTYDRHAFPSGHATRMGTLPVFGAWMFPGLAPLFWTISLACIWARVALGIHFLADVIVGWLIGAVVSVLALALLGGGWGMG
jgi:undecaprenyl-diphosphatase